MNKGPPTSLGWSRQQHTSAPWLPQTSAHPPKHTATLLLNQRNEYMLMPCKAACTAGTVLSIIHLLVHGQVVNTAGMSKWLTLQPLPGAVLRCAGAFPANQQLA